MPDLPEQSADPLEPVTNLTSLLAVDAVSVRFTSVGSDSVRIDDVYLDPWKST